MEEYISREAVERILICRCGWFPEEAHALAMAIPAADVCPVVRGGWVPHFEDYRGMMESNKCSVCGYEYYGTIYNFCPNCGAVMDEGNN